VEQPVGSIGVLGEVHVPARWVDSNRLVREAAECRQWLGVPVRVAIARVHLEHVAVVLRDRAAGALLGLLAREPCAPRGRTAGAVVERPRQAHVLERSVVVPVDEDRGGPAGAARVVGEIQISDGREGRGLGLFVVVHEEHATPGPVERRGAVRAARDDASRLPGEGPARLGDDRVAEPLREVEDAGGVGLKRSEAAVVLGDRAEGARRKREAQSVDGACPEHAEAGSGTLEQRPARDLHGPPSSVGIGREDLPLR
jgi:hypothetical protein